MAPRAPTAFISYSREDSAFALRLAGDLKAAGANVWLDQMDIEPGQEWDSAIEDAVTQAPRMLLILSPPSVKSRNVRNEISFALEEKKTIIPVFYQDCTVPLQLHRIHRIDFRADYARGLKALLKTLGVETPAAASATAASEVSMTSQPVLSDPGEPGAQTRGKEPSKLSAERERQQRIQAAKRAQFEEERKREQPSDHVLRKFPAWSERSEKPNTLSPEKDAAAKTLHAKGEYSSAVPPPPPSKAAPRIRVDRTVQAASLVNKVTPQYPPIAKRAHVSGTVILHAIISKDGSIDELQYVDGPPILMKSAMDAVKEWRYKPTMRDGELVEVDTTISVEFSLLRENDDFDA